MTMGALCTYTAAFYILIFFYHPLMNLAKLKTYSVRDSRSKLLDSYFKDCFHRVKLGPAVSEWEMVSRGCSQGSTFGPLLWNIYQKSYICVILMLTSTCTVYADDHLFYAMSSDMEIVKKNNVPCFSNVWCSTLLCTKEIQVGKLP